MRTLQMDVKRLESGKFVKVNIYLDGRRYAFFTGIQTYQSMHEDGCFSLDGKPVDRSGEVINTTCTFIEKGGVL
jgi:hypothetical protein